MRTHGAACYRVFAVVAAVALGTALMHASFAAGEIATEFRATLTGAQEVPPVSTTTEATAGVGVFALIGTGTVQYTLTATSASPITGAHLHCGAAGTNGPIVVSLFSNPSGATNRATTSTSTTVFAGLLASGTITNTQIATGTSCTPAIGSVSDLVTAMNAGTIYANIHTLAHPGGAARGQLMPAGTTTATTTPATSTPTTTPPVDERITSLIARLQELIERLQTLIDRLLRR